MVGYPHDVFGEGMLVVVYFFLWLKLLSQEEAAWSSYWSICKELWKDSIDV